jgi:hypothetical protein
MDIGGNKKGSGKYFLLKFFRLIYEGENEPTNSEIVSFLAARG